MLRGFKKSRAGWSLIELSIILIVLSILCAILAPVIGRFVRNAKVVRCREDVQAIGCAMWMFMEDTSLPMFLQVGHGAGVGALASRPDLTSLNRVDMLVGDGFIPMLNPAVGATGADWVSLVNYGTVDFVEYHLIKNTPGNNPVNYYLTPVQLTAVPPGGDPMFASAGSAGFNSEFAWRGPYITAPIDPDPWGMRYAVNVGFLDPCARGGANAALAGGSPINVPGANGMPYDVVVLSAGPDSEVDTAYMVDGQAPGDDDILYVMGANSRP